MKRGTTMTRLKISTQLWVLAAVLISCGDDGSPAAEEPPPAPASDAGDSPEPSMDAGDDASEAKPEPEPDAGTSLVREALPCRLDTGHDGDDACMLAPDADEGFQ